MRIENLRVLQEIATKMADPSQVLSQEERIQCIGLEFHIGGAMGRLRHRCNHAQEILAKQDTCTEDELCSVSRESSKLARRRANKLATYYWQKIRA